MPLAIGLNFRTIAPWIPSLNLYYEGTLRGNSTHQDAGYTTQTANKSTVEMTDPAFVTALNGDQGHIVWLPCDGTNDGYPVLNNAYRMVLPVVADAVVAPVTGYSNMFMYKGADYQFTITPDDPSLWADDMVVEANEVPLTPDMYGVYTIEGDPDDAVVITATGVFTDRKLHIIVDYNNEGGSVTTTDEIPVIYGGSVTHAITPNTGWETASITVNEVEQPITDVLELTNITDHMNIEVVFMTSTSIKNVKAEAIALSYKAGVISIDAKTKVNKVSVYMPDGRLIAQQQGIAPISIGNYPVVIVVLEINETQVIRKLISK
jgi:hypothetical protein